MRYVIMAGGVYDKWKYPRQLSMIHGETLIERTVRLLKENGISSRDIAISTNNRTLRTELLKKDLHYTYIVHHNGFEVKDNTGNGFWVDCFCPSTLPICYLFGDVVYSPFAIKKIVETETDGIEFFASAPPFAENYSKKWAEPFAFKVVDQIYFRECINEVRNLQLIGAFNRVPIAWELWQVIKKTPLNKIDYTNYTIINDYTCDIDEPADILKYEGGEEWHTI